MSSLAPIPGRPLWDRRAVRVLQVVVGVMVGAGLVAVFALADADATAQPNAEAQLVDALVVEAGELPAVDLTTRVVMVTGRACDGHTGGSGWYLGDGRLVTASHVVDAAAALTAQANGEIAFGDHDRMSVPVGDLTVAAMDRAIAAPLQLGRDPEIGEAVVFAGMARDGRVHVLDATVTAVVGAADYGLDGGDLFVLDEMAAPGMSGGPVVDAQGRAVGVIRAIEQSTGISLITPISELWTLLDVAATPEVDTDCQ